MHLVDLARGQQIATFEADSLAGGPSLSPNGRYAAGAESGWIYLWRLPDSEPAAP